jgi:hypothetical protein
LGHHLLELLFLLAPEVVLLLALALVAGVVLVVVVVLVGGVELLPLGAVGDEVVVSPYLKQPLGDLLLSLWNLCNTRNFLASRVISSSPYRIIKSIQQLFSTFIIRISKRTT